MASSVAFDITADLKCEFRGKAFQVRDDGSSRIICDLPDLKTLFTLRKLANDVIPIDQIVSGLSKIERTMEVRVAGQCVAQLGENSSGVFGRLIGFPATRIFWRNLFRSSWDRDN